MRAVVFLAGLLIGCPTLAGDPRADGNCKVVGYISDDLSCANWLKAYDRRNDAQLSIYRPWIQGFLTGRNHFAVGNIEVDNARIDAFVTEYCRKKPLELLSIAAYELVREAGGPQRPRCE